MRSYTSYWRNVVAILIVSGLLFFPLSAQAAETIFYEQLPDHRGGFFSGESPRFPFVVADQFIFTQPTQIGNITWWGGYGGTFIPQDNFTIRLYADDGGQPGVLLRVFNIGNTASRTATGNWVNPPRDNFPGRPEFQYSFNLPTIFLVETGQFYWLSIVNTMDLDDWVWESSSSSQNPGIQRTFQSGPWHPTGFPDNTAFQLRTASPMTVGIDIQPGSFPNRINLKGTSVRVAVLSGSAFNAPSQVDYGSLTFGRTGEEQSLVGCSTFPDFPQDVNGDGLIDLICRFNISFTGFQFGDTIGTLRGMTVDGRFLTGTDSVDIYIYP